jgi:hypothetical protein
MIRKPIELWNQFWFDSRTESYLYSMAVFRILFALTMIFFFSTRFPDLDFFYSQQGIMPSEYLRSLPQMKYLYSIFYVWNSSAVLYACHTALIVGLLFLAAGFFTRFFAVLVYFLMLMFMHRNPTAMFGVDMIAAYYFFYLMFSDAGARWSIDARRSKVASQGTTVGFIAYRLMQIQVCVVYGYSGLEKIRGVRWWDGSAMWDVLAIGTMQRWDMSFMAHTPILLAVMAYVVLVWEIYFPVLIWVKKAKYPVLAFGLAMHVGIGLFLNLPSFAAMMIAYYALFLTKEELLSLKPKRN